MTNKIRNVSSFSFLRSNNVVRSSPTATVDVATTSEVMVDSVQIVGTAHELIAAGDATDTCFARIENLSTTAVIQVGGDSHGTFVPWFTIAPGDHPAIIPRIASLAATYLDSDTASTPVRVTLCKIVAPS